MRIIPLKETKGTESQLNTGEKRRYILFFVSLITNDIWKLQQLNEKSLLYTSLQFSQRKFASRKKDM